MTVDKTTIEWSYEPLDFFESTIHRSCPEYDLVIQDGRAQATLKTPTDPIPEDLKTAIQKELEAIFAAWQVCMHRTHTPLELERMSIRQHHSDGSTVYHAAIAGSGSMYVTGRADSIVTDASGRVLRDSRTERITEQDRFGDLILKATPKHPLVRTLLKSYGDAVDDPDNELIHLYEIRDALGKYFGKDQTARKRLHIKKAEWRRLGDLANDEPLKQGRHRGKHFKELRPASSQELEEARVIAKKLIEVFIHTL